MALDWCYPFNIIGDELLLNFGAKFQSHLRFVQILIIRIWTKRA